MTLPCGRGAPVVVLDVHRPFVVFGDHDSLSMEPVEGADLIPVRAPDDERFRWFASTTWSADCSWYFVALSNGIGVFSVATGRGFLCRKRSAQFIEMFIKAPLRAGRADDGLSQERRR